MALVSSLWNRSLISLVSTQSQKAFLLKKVFETAFLNEVMVSSVNFTYSGTLQIKGLASVVGFSLETLYPDQTNKLLSIYQNAFLPRNSKNSDQVLRIMWTNTSGWADRSKEFKVNHFVPLLRKSSHEGKPDADWKLLLIKESIPIANGTVTKG